MRVQARVLAAIEQNDPSALPPRPFGRGFVRAYAQEVGLNPEQTVRDYFSQFAPPQDPVEPAVTHVAEQPAHPSRFRAAAIVLLLAAVATGVLIVRQAGRPARDGAVVGTSGTVAAPAPISPDTSHRPVAGPTNAPPKSAVAIDAVIAVTAPSWVAATADGQRVIYRVMNPGERATVRATNLLSIRTGNAGGLTWTINGRERGPLGGPGEVKTTTVKLQNGQAIVVP